MITPQLIIQYAEISLLCQFCAEREIFND